jgi:hypothetical protein
MKDIFPMKLLEAPGNGFNPRIQSDKPIVCFESAQASNK